MDGNNSSYMELALAEAEAAGQRGEVPVGAVIIDASGTVLAAGDHALHAAALEVLTGD